MLLIGDGAVVASCPMLSGGGFLLYAARWWLLARCCTTVASVASCPMQRGGGFLPDGRGGGFLPDAAQRWAAGGFSGLPVASLLSVVECTMIAHG